MTLNSNTGPSVDLLADCRQEKTADELRNEAARIREFMPWLDDQEVVAEILALAEELERRAHEVSRDAAERRISPAARPAPRSGPDLE